MFNQSNRTIRLGKSSVAVALLFYGGWLLVVSGLMHILPFLIEGERWDGPVSWRKPILFGVSTGVTLISIAWIVPKLRLKKIDRYVLLILAVSLLIEVGLITLQQWRGVASHFNNSSKFDSVIDFWMTLLITLATIAILVVAWRSRRRIRARPDMVLAIRAGLWLLVVSCLIGFAILIHGKSQVAAGMDPSTYGVAGVTKFPHGIAIHALQILPIGCWFMKRLKFPIEVRYRLTKLAVLAVILLLFYSVVQTLAGQPWFEPSLSAAPFLVASVIAFSLLVFTAVRTSLALLWHRVGT